MKGKKIVSLGLTLYLAFSPLTCTRVFAEKTTSTQINFDANVKSSEEYKLLKEKLEKCMAEQAKLEKKVKKENKKSLSLIKQIIKLGILITIFSVIVAEYYNFKCYNDYNIKTPFFRNIVEKFTDYTGLIVRGICPKILRPFRDYGAQVDELLIRLSDFLENSIRSLKNLINPEEENNLADDL